MSDDRENDEVKLKPKTAFDLLFLAIIYIEKFSSGLTYFNRCTIHILSDWVLMNFSGISYFTPQLFL